MPEVSVDKLKLANDSSCCSASEPDAEFDADRIAELCKAIAHPARVKLLRYLEEFGECYFGKLTDILPLAPSTISQHVTILKNAGLLSASADEQHMCYCVNTSGMNQLKQLIQKL